MNIKIRFKYLQDANETYSQHFKVASNSGLKMIVAGICLIIHAIYPAVFLTTGSTLVKTTAEFFKQRSEKKV